MHHNVAVVGEKESVLCFQSVGFEVFSVAPGESAEPLLRDLTKQAYAIIFVTEQVLAPILSLLGDYKNQMLPAIIPIPGHGGSLGIGMAGVRACVERAVGADILFQQE